MKQKISKSEAEKQIKDFFENIEDKTHKEIKKIKKLAMSYKIPLKEKRKLFCRECLTPYSGNEKIRIKNKMKIIICKNCEKENKFKIKN